MPARRGHRRRVPANWDHLQKRVLRAYTNPGHVVAYSAPATVAKYFGISPKRAKYFLEHNEGYTLHREYKRPSTYNPYYVHNRRDQVQADLIDIARIATKNDGVKFLLLIIDIFTKKVWVYPLIRKTAGEMKQALQTWLNGLQVKPSKFVSDRGLEFLAASTQLLLRNANIEWQPANGTMKAAVAERANKTIQILIYKYLTENETLRYIDVLPRLIATYNRRPHRSLDGMSPNQADAPRNEHLVQAVAHERYAKLG